MKETILAISAIIGGIVGLMFGIYAFIGLANYIISDPFNWVDNDEQIEKTIYTEIEKCKQLGGHFWYYESGDALYCDYEKRIKLN